MTSITNPQNYNRDRQRSLRALLKVCDVMRTLDDDIPLQTVTMFLLIAEHEGLSLIELTQRLGMASSSASRNVAALSKVHRLRKPGLDLVVSKEDPRDRRRKTHHLTPKGRRVAQQMLDALED